ncbi:anti-sigma-F factor Fin [Sporosarcina sp. ITBMC105]
MTIRYSCRHCNTEVGSIPFSSAGEVIQQVQQTEREHDGHEHFIEYNQDGSLTVRCICEECEQSLLLFPDYYALKKWLQ